jgi:hypothetical protein
VTTDFAEKWDADDHDRDTARSQHGYLDYNAGGPIFWKSLITMHLVKHGIFNPHGYRKRECRNIRYSTTVRLNPSRQIGKIGKDPPSPEQTWDFPPIRNI